MALLSNFSALKKPIIQIKVINSTLDVLSLISWSTTAILMAIWWSTSTSIATSASSTAAHERKTTSAPSTASHAEATE